jgi:hypothetical protein
MNYKIDLRTMPANVPVLCIPRVYPNISESRIRRIFDDLNMGVLERIDIVSKASEKGEKFNRVFIHFRRWNDTENANNARERLLNGKEIKIIYDDPWFWKISAYREAERKPSAPQNAGQRKATLQFDSDDEERTSNKNSYYRHQDDRKAQGANISTGALEPFGRRPDVRPRPDIRPRPDDVRRRPDDIRRRPDDVRRRPDDIRPRPDDIRPRPPRTPPCSPQKAIHEETIHETSLLKTPQNEDKHVNEGLKINYGNITFPKRKKLVKAKAAEVITKTLKIEDENKVEKKDDEKEEGEISE